MDAKELMNIPDWNGDARLCELNPPFGEHKYVVVSAVDTMFSGPETYIFPSNNEGEVMDFAELEGSFRGSKDHIKALRNIGYEIPQHH